MGYGPLVRASTGLTSLSRYPDDPQVFADGTTIHPDHYAARVTAIAALAALIGRRQSGRGAEIATAQAEAILMQIGTLLVAEALGAGAGQATSHVYPCAGDDEWCVVSVRDDEDRRRLEVVLGDEDLSTWTRARPPREVAATLQAAGVPAGFMQRADEYEDDPQLQARDFFRVLQQPGLEPMTVDNAPFRSERIPEPQCAPAPELGEHTREVCAELLGMSAAEIERLIVSGALEDSLASAHELR